VKLVRTFLSLIFIVFLVVSARAQKEDWLPVTQQDLEIKQVPGSPGADESSFIMRIILTMWTTMSFSINALRY